MRPANARAASLARSSPFVRASYGAIESLARTIGDATLRESVVALLHDPRPTYAYRHPTPEAREAVKQQLVAAGHVKAADPLEGIFPPGTLPADAHAPQPFWSTPGSFAGGHHSYPGGLVAHELFNARMAANFAQTYDANYFGGRHGVDRDTVVAAALYHDIMKSVVFQWKDDGMLLDELTIAGTGGHHPLSGAEAIVRGRSPQFVTVLLCAHAAPSFGDEKQVAAWAHAASIIAGVDPFDFGLLRRTGDGYALAREHVTIEGFVNHLSDHDYVLTQHAVQTLDPHLRNFASKRIGTDAEELIWWRNGVLARASAVALYQTLAEGGEAALDRSLVVLSK